MSNNTIESDSYGIRFNNGYVIGNTPVTYEKGSIIVLDKEFIVTEGLQELLTKRFPQAYTSEDLQAYKNILTLTHAHKKHYKAENSVNANTSWKYKHIISLLFPPKRRNVNKILNNIRTNENMAEIPTNERNFSKRNDEYICAKPNKMKETEVQRPEPLKTEEYLEPNKIEETEVQMSDQPLLRNKTKCRNALTENDIYTRSENVPEGRYALDMEPNVTENRHVRRLLTEDPNEVIDNMRVALLQGKSISNYITTLVKMYIIKNPRS